MKIEMSGPELGEFGKAASNGQPVDRVTAQILQCASHEITHVYQGVIGQAVKALDGALRGRASCRCDMVETSGAGDIDPAMDRVDP